MLQGSSEPVLEFQVINFSTSFSVAFIISAAVRTRNERLLAKVCFPYNINHIITSVATFCRKYPLGSVRTVIWFQPKKQVAVSKLAPLNVATPGCVFVYLISISRLFVLIQICYLLKFIRSYIESAEIACKKVAKYQVDLALLPDPNVGSFIVLSLIFLLQKSTSKTTRLLSGSSVFQVF